MRRTSMAVGVLLLALMPVLAGCGTAAAPSTSSPTATPATPATTASTTQTTACQGVVAVGQSLTSLSQVGSNTTIGEVKATQQKITTQLDAIAARIPGENGPVLTRLQAANNEITAAILSLPDSATIAQTSTGVQGFQTKVANAQAAQTQLATRLKCTP